MNGRNVRSLKRKGFRVTQMCDKRDTNVSKLSVSEVKSLPNGITVHSISSESKINSTNKIPFIENIMDTNICKKTTKQQINVSKNKKLNTNAVNNSLLSDSVT